MASDVTLPRILAIHAHPDDIELMMAGTLALLGEAGYELHMMNIANGCCGTATENPETIVRKRTEEARESAKTLNAHFHPPIANDIEVFYTMDLIRKVGAVIRDVSPSIMLVQSVLFALLPHVRLTSADPVEATATGSP